MGEPRFPGSLPVSSITFNNAIVTGGVFSVVHQSNDGENANCVKD